MGYKESIYDESKLTEIIYNIGNNIRNVRKEKGYTIEQISELTNIDKSHISRIENGINRIGIASLLKIADVLDVSVNELIYN